MINASNASDPSGNDRTSLSKPAVSPIEWRRQRTVSGEQEGEGTQSEFPMARHGCGE